MNAVLYFTCSGQSKLAAEKISEKLGFSLIELRKDMNASYDTAVIVFPVHCQSIPKPLKAILKKITVKNAALVATYGKENPGNALLCVAKYFTNIVAAAYLPTKHTYKDEISDIPDLPPEFYKKIAVPYGITIPKRKCTPFSNFLPSFRSRIIIKIKKLETCNGCEVCTSVCPADAIKNGLINSKCIRCLKCVCNCPQKALVVKQSFFLKRYLRKERINEIILYT